MVYLVGYPLLLAAILFSIYKANSFVEPKVCTQLCIPSLVCISTPVWRSQGACTLRLHLHEIRGLLLVVRSLKENVSITTADRRGVSYVLPKVGWVSASPL